MSTLAACSDEAEAEPAATPKTFTSSASPSAPTEEELIGWVESFPEFDGKRDDAREYLDADAQQVYRFFCRELSNTSLPSEVFEEGLEMVFELNQVWGYGSHRSPDYNRRYEVNETLNESIGLERKRLMQYRVAVGTVCPSSKETFLSWEGSR